jgi:hypothetical protein
LVSGFLQISKTHPITTGVIVKRISVVNASTSGKDMAQEYRGIVNSSLFTRFDVVGDRGLAIYSGTDFQGAFVKESQGKGGFIRAASRCFPCHH